ncbi:uncharacterized protein LOC136023151 isoform X2 [Lathamus discolor]|uniref:uncharacterized protein LOC136023151 isoform X2 n=1 Tax=Lathamus discolor TaxID=678569 RepID=UPI0032B738AC
MAGGRESSSTRLEGDWYPLPQMSRAGICSSHTFLPEVMPMEDSWEQSSSSALCPHPASGAAGGALLIWSLLKRLRAPSDAPRRDVGRRAGIITTDPRETTGLGEGKKKDKIKLMSRYHTNKQEPGARLMDEGLWAQTRPVHPFPEHHWLRALLEQKMGHVPGKPGLGLTGKFKLSRMPVSAKQGKLRCPLQSRNERSEKAGSLWNARSSTSASSFPALLDSDAPNPLQMLEVGHPPAPTWLLCLLSGKSRFRFSANAGGKWHQQPPLLLLRSACCK